MSYYMGDFYQGDYYAGDPFFGGLFKGIARAAGGLLGIGKKARPVFGGFGTPPLLPAGTPAAAGIASRMGALGRAGGEMVRRAGRVIARHPVLSAAGAAGTIGILGGRVSAPEAAMRGMAQRGFHISARTGQLVRNRRMRVTNPKALRRAIRRATGFARLAKRVLRFTSPRAPRGRAVFKFKRRKRV